MLYRPRLMKQTRRFLNKVTQAERRDLKAGETKTWIKRKPQGGGTISELLPQKQEMGRSNSWKMAPIQQRKIRIQQQRPWKRKLKRKRPTENVPSSLGKTSKSTTQVRGWVSLAVECLNSKQNCSRVKGSVEFTCLNAKKIGILAKIGRFL